jgi:hypothetical protein
MRETPGIAPSAASSGSVTARSFAAGSIASERAVTTTTGNVMSGKSASLSERKQKTPATDRTSQNAIVAQG